MFYIAICFFPYNFLRLIHSFRRHSEQPSLLLWVDIPIIKNLVFIFDWRASLFKMIASFWKILLLLAKCIYSFSHHNLALLTVTHHRSLYRGSRPEVFCKKGVLRNFAKFKGKYLCQSLFFNKVATLFKKETLSQVFFCEFCKISKNIFCFPPGADSDFSCFFQYARGRGSMRKIISFVQNMKIWEIHSDDVTIWA